MSCSRHRVASVQGRRLVFAISHPPWKNDLEMPLNSPIFIQHTFQLLEEPRNAATLLCDFPIPC